MIVGPQPLSDFYKGKTKADKMNCGIITIQIL